MKKKKKIKNSAFVTALEELRKVSAKSSAPLMEILMFDSEIIGKAVTALMSEPGIRDNYDVFHALDVLEITIQQNQAIRGEKLRARYLCNLQESYNEWVTVIPCDFEPFLRASRSFQSPIWYGSVGLLPPTSTVKSFIRFFKARYNIELNHQGVEHCAATSQEALIKRPLFLIQNFGSRDIVDTRAFREFTRFYELQCLYGAQFSRILFGRNTNVPRSLHYFRINLKKGSVEREPLPLDPTFFLPFNRKLQSRFLKNNFTENLKIVSGLTKQKMITRVQASLHYFGRAYQLPDPVTSFLFYLISLESLFSRDKNTPLRVTLADSVSLLCYPRIDRLGIHRKVKQLYDQRSAIVHTGLAKVTTESRDQAREFAMRSLWATLKLVRNSPDPYSFTEQEFFNHILQKKLN